jgi:hypothetical protein
MEIPRLQKRVNRATVLAVIVDSCKQLGYQQPKKEQIEAIFEFVSGRDAFLVYLWFYQLVQASLCVMLLYH